MFPYLLLLVLALFTTAACTDPPPPSVPKRTITWSTVETTMPTTTTSRSSPFTEGKPCELLSRDEAAKYGIELPGLEETTPAGLACTVNGKDFSMIVAIANSVPLSRIEASRPGRRITVADRAASLAMSQNKDQFAGLCDIAIDVNNSSHARILLSRYDKNTQAACINAGAVALLIERRLPDG